MRVVVVDDLEVIGRGVVEALSTLRPEQSHQVVAVLSPEELAVRLAAERFELALVDIHFGRESRSSGLVALRHLDQAGIPIVLYHAEEENRALYLLAAFRFYEPVAILPKSANLAEIRQVVQLVSRGVRPVADQRIRRYRPGRGVPMLDRLVTGPKDLAIWRALAVHASAPDVAMAANVGRRTVDTFLAERFDAMREVESEVIGRPQVDGLGRNQHLIGPMHAFARAHEGFFADPEVTALVTGSRAESARGRRVPRQAR
jgi:DNA-binding NarL/FixJ family response regulator